MKKSEIVSKMISKREGRAILHNTLGSLVAGTCNSPEDLINLYRETADQIESHLKEYNQDKNQLFFDF